MFLEDHAAWTLRRPGRTALCTAIAVAFAAACTTAASQTTDRAPVSVFAYDRSASLDVREASRAERDGFVFIDLTYLSPKGGRVPAYLWVPLDPGPHPGLVLMHGLPGTRDGMVRLGDRYARAGAVAIAITAPFARTEAGLQRPVSFTSADRGQQVQLIVDLQRAVDVLVAREDVDPSRLGYVGVSYGGAMGGLLAGVERRITAYALVVGDGGLVAHFSGPDDRGGWLDTMPASQRDAWLAAMQPIEPIRFVGDAAPARLLFQNARADRLVPAADAERYQAAGSEPKELRWYDGGHGVSPEMLRDQAAWFAKVIGLRAESR